MSLVHLNGPVNRSDTYSPRYTLRQYCGPLYTVHLDVFFPLIQNYLIDRKYLRIEVLEFTSESSVLREYRFPSQYTPTTPCLNFFK